MCEGFFFLRWFSNYYKRRLFFAEKGLDYHTTTAFSVYYWIFIFICDKQTNGVSCTHTKNDGLILHEGILWNTGSFGY